MAAETSFQTPYESDVPESSYGEPHRKIGRSYQKTIIVDQEPHTHLKRSTSPVIPPRPGDRHLTVSVIVLILSILFCNPFALAFAIPAVIFSVKARSAEMEGKKEHMQVNDKTSFGFAIFAMIAWIVSLCIAGFVTYRELCGPTGTRCETRTHI